MFYTFNQNNSGGSFDFDKNRGITHYVIIEANDPEHANRRAEDIGIYFDGCESGEDCPCCGDRWYPTSEYYGDEIPKVYDTPVEEYQDIFFKEDHSCVHYLDGTKRWCSND